MTTAFESLILINVRCVCICSVCLFFCCCCFVNGCSHMVYLWFGSGMLIVFVRRLVNKRRRYSTKENNTDKCYNIGRLNWFQSKPEDLKAFYYLQSIVYRAATPSEWKKKQIHSARIATETLLRPRLKWISAFTSY